MIQQTLPKPDEMGSGIFVWLRRNLACVTVCNTNSCQMGPEKLSGLGDNLVYSNLAQAESTVYSRLCLSQIKWDQEFLSGLGEI